MNWHLFHIQQNKISLQDNNNIQKKMNKCQHNLPIDKFCINQHCQWKQPGGCQQCIKKYHTHYRQNKIISQLQLIQYMKIFSTSQNSHKPNCRNIQQAFYTYFNQLKNQLNQNIDLLCKTVINFVGSPYMMQNKLFNCYKRIKNKQYRRINQKDIYKFCQLAKITTSNTILKQQTTLYKQQLKKFIKLVQNLQSITLSYQDLLSQANLTFKHQKSHFDNLSKIIKQTLQITDHTISISQFHQKSLQKNKIVDKNQKKQSSTLRSFNSQQYEKNKSKYNEKSIPSFYSALLPNKQKEQKLSKKENSLIGSKTQRQSYISKDHSLHKFGVRDFNQFQKKQNNKQTINSINLKRPSSLQRNLPSNNNKTLIPQIFIGKNNRVKNQFKIDEYDQFFSPQIQKQKIHILDKNTKKNNSGIAEIFGIQNKSTFFTSEQSKRTQFLLQARQKRQLSQKETEINQRKQKLIEMMKSHQFSKKSSEPIQVENLVNIPIKNYSKDTITKQIMKKDNKEMKNNSALVNPSINRSETIQKSLKLKKNISLIVEDRDFKSMPPMKQRKYSDNQTPHTLFNNLQIDQINPISECVSQTYSVGSLQEIKKLIPEINMNGIAKLPISQEEEKPKVMVCSRLIIVPTLSKFPNDNASDSPLIKKKTVSIKASPQKKQNRIKEKSPLKAQRKQSIRSQPCQQKQEMTESQQRSLTLLIKSINQKPQQAIFSLQTALKQSPNNLSAAEYLSFLYLQGQKPRQALCVCNKILDRFEIMRKENEQLLINLQNNKAAALNMLGRYSQAIVLLLKCIKVKQTDCILKNLADAYYFSSNYDKAISYYEKTLKLSPNYDQAYHNMAVCFYLQQNYQRAKHSLQKAIEIASKNTQYLEFRKHIQERLMQKIR